jgi:hypothetical protein
MSFRVDILAACNSAGGPILANLECMPTSESSNRSPRKRNRSLDTPSAKFRILKNRSVETALAISDSRRKTGEIPRQRPGVWPLTYGNFGSLQSSGSHPEETAVAG